MNICGREIHLWTVRLEAPADTISRAHACLSPDEAVRMARYRFEHLRRVHTLSRGVLRFLLGRYAGLAPDEIRLVEGSKGKPAMANPGAVQFNTSHSGGLALFAFTSDGELGVDVERIRPILDWHQIAANYFCPEEATELMSAPAGERERAFFVCWTRKEAFIKATGEGLSLPLDSFRVTLLPGEPARFVHVGRDSAAARDWSLQHIDPAPGFVGAVAYRGAPRPLCARPLVNAGELFELLREDP